MNLKISRILHAGYVFESNETQIAFDPIFENPFSRNCFAFPDVHFDHEKIKNIKFSAIFISHFHDDHCSLKSLNYLDRNTPIYIFCIHEELFSMVKELGFTNVYSLKLNVTILIGSFAITPRRALDAEVDSIFHIQAAGLNILNVVDSWIDSLTLDQLSLIPVWDMILWPFQTMREIEVLSPQRAESAPPELPSEWLEQIKILNPRYIVPSSCQFIHESWSWYNQALFPISYRQFEKEISAARPQTRVVRLNPSISVELTKNSIEISSPLKWIKPIGNQDVDYEYLENSQAPTTAEIARHFEALTTEQEKLVLDYCHVGLIQKFKSLQPSQETYFNKAINWQLTIYDHRGKPTHFSYLLCANNIQLVEKFNTFLSWTTEVPASKLYAALNDGEALTSMYMRINDIIFDPQIKEEIQDVDIIEDPLIRCLFTNSFGAYQKAQLLKLKTDLKR